MAEACDQHPTRTDAAQCCYLGHRPLPAHMLWLPASSSESLSLCPLANILSTAWLPGMELIPPFLCYWDSQVLLEWCLFPEALGPSHGSCGPVFCQVHDSPLQRGTKRKSLYLVSEVFPFWTIAPPSCGGLKESKVSCMPHRVANNQDWIISRTQKNLQTPKYLLPYSPMPEITSTENNVLYSIIRSL